jgi:hypothetical protein
MDLLKASVAFVDRELIENFGSTCLQLHLRGKK